MWGRGWRGGEVGREIREEEGDLMTSYITDIIRRRRPGLLNEEPGG